MESLFKHRPKCHVNWMDNYGQIDTVNTCREDPIIEAHRVIDTNQTTRFIMIYNESESWIRIQTPPECRRITYRDTVYGTKLLVFKCRAASALDELFK
jgi:hypothetical protein